MSAYPNTTFTEVTPGQNPDDYSTGWAIAANRLWRLSTAGLCANLPENNARRRIVVDATRASVDAYVVVDTTANASDSQAMCFVPAGTQLSLAAPEEIHRGKISIGTIGNTAGSAVIVSEYSY
jgi:hypothetical protein